MDREYLTHGIEVGLGFIKTYHPMAHMHTPEGRERLTKLLVDHLVNNWEGMEQMKAVTKAASELTDSLEESVASLDLKDADLGTTCKECGNTDGWHYVKCGRMTERCNGCHECNNVRYYGTCSKAQFYIDPVIDKI